MEVRQAADSIGVQLHGEEGHPFHCGERMTVKGGIFGVDYARCECGALMYRIDSPHTNGGYFLNEEALDNLGEAVWVAEPGAPQPGLSPVAALRVRVGLSPAAVPVSPGAEEPT